MPTPHQTPDELRIAESYQRVLGDIARCAQAVRDGDWGQLAGMAEELSRHAVHLAVAAGEPRDPGTRPRAETVLDALPREGSPIIRALHPPRPTAITRNAMIDPFTHPNAQPADR